MIVDCLTIAAAIASAQPGATLTVRPGSDCPPLEVRNRRWPTPITIVADGARFKGVRLFGVDGLNWRGGTIVAEGGFDGPSLRGYAVRILDARNIVIENAVMRDAARGAVVGDGANIVFRNNHLHDLRTDGLNFARSDGVIVERNRFHSFHRIKRTCLLPSGEDVGELRRSVCEGKGAVWRDGDHPDAVQFWGGTRNARVIDNWMEGDFQGIGHFGRSEPAFNLVAERNHVRGTFTNGITFGNCTDCRIVNNDVGRLRPDGRRVRIAAPNSTGAFCGNRAPDVRPDSPIVRPCPGGSQG